MAPTDQEISDTISKLSKAGAPDEFIAKYLDTAKQEQAAVSGRKQFSPDQITGMILGEMDYAKQQEPAVGTMSTTTGMTQEQYARRQASAEASLQALERDFGKVMGTAIEVGAPIAATILTGGTALPAAIAYRAGAGIAGTGVRRFLEGQDVFSSQGVGQMVESGILASAPIPQFGTGLKEVVKAGATLGSISAGASVVGQLSEKALRTPEEQKSVDEKLAEVNSSQGALIASNALKSGIGGFAFGSSLHALGSAFAKFAQSRAEIDASRRYFEEAGINPTLGMLLPDRAGLERTVAQSRPELAARIDSAPSSVFKSFWTRLGEVPDNALMQTRFKDVIPMADNAEKAVVAAKSRVTEAEKALNDARAAAEIDPAMLQKLEADHAARLLEEVTVTASAENKITQMMGDAVGPTEHANMITGLMKKLNDSVSAISSSLYSKTGLRPDQTVIPRDKLVSATERALHRVGAMDTPYGQKILSVVRGNVAEEGTAAEKAVANAANESVSWSEYQGFRNAMSNSFGGIAPGQMDAANKAASDVYREIGQELVRHFERTPELRSAVAPLRTAMDFYRDISQIRDSNVGGELFRIPIFMDPSSPQFRIAGVKASSLDNIAEALRRGDTDTLNNLYAFVSRVSKYSPEAGQSVVGAVHSALRDNFLAKNRGNPIAVLDDLLATAKTRDMVPFVESLGFGNMARIKQMKEGFKQYKPSEITSDVIDSVLTNPNIPDAIPRAIFDARVKAAALLSATNDKAGAAKKLAEAIDVAKKANISEAEAVRIFNDYKSNDLISAFSGFGNYSLTAEAGVTGRGTISHLLQQMPEDVAAKAMNELRKKDKNMADLVSRKIWADELQSAARTEKNIPGETTKFDLAKFERIFNPNNPNEVQRLKWLNAVAGSAITSDMKKFLQAVTKAETNLRKGGYVTEVNVEKLSTAANVAGAMGVPLGELGPLGLTALTRRVARAARGGYYNLITYLATDPKLAKRVATASRVVDVLKDENVQRAYSYYANGRLVNDLAKLDQDEQGARFQIAR